MAIELVKSCTISQMVGGGGGGGGPWDSFSRVFSRILKVTMSYLAQDVTKKFLHKTLQVLKDT